MNKSTAYGGVFTALGILLLTLAAYLPSGKAVCLFAASLTVFCSTHILNTKHAAVMYAATSALGFFISKGTSPATIVSYIICFGNYPLFKKAADAKKPPVAVIVKSLLYTAYFFSAFVIFKFFIKADLLYGTVPLFIGGAVLFVLYDILLAKTNEYALNIINKNNKLEK